MTAAPITHPEEEWLKRRRRLKVKVWLFGPLVGFPAAFLVAMLGKPAEYVAIGIAVASVISGAVFGNIYQLSRCPRCGRLFWAIHGKMHFIWYSKSCRHCGFPGQLKP